LDAVATADDPQPLVADPAVLFADRHSHEGELAGRARRQAVTADLVARERRLVEKEDGEARLGAVVRGRGTRRTATDDDDVGVIVHRAAHLLLPRESDSH